MEHKTKIINLLHEHLPVALDHEFSDTDILADLGADSLDVIGLGVRLEDEFEIDFKMGEFETVGDVFELLERHMEWNSNGKKEK